MKLYIAGIHGMVGSAIAKASRKKSFSVIGKSSSELDLRNRLLVSNELKSTKPDALIIAAARVGGISANNKYPVKFLSDNLQIQTNLLDAAHEAGIKRVLFLGSSCAYPKFSLQPIKETELLSGYLEATNEAYAVAKISGIKLVDAYYKEFGHNWLSVMPTNIYGEQDNFDLETAHVLPALIRKFVTAVDKNLPEVEIWGDGTPFREFLHADDLAEACLFLLDHNSANTLINVGYGSDVTIYELAKLIAKVTNFNGNLIFNPNYPNGTPRKLLDSKILKGMGWSPRIELEQGIIDTVNWYKNFGLPDGRST
jgi:GDP-L-fucose synthase